MRRPLCSPTGKSVGPRHHRGETPARALATAAWKGDDRPQSLWRLGAAMPSSWRAVGSRTCEREGGPAVGKTTLLPRPTPRASRLRRRGRRLARRGRSGLCCQTVGANSEIRYREGAVFRRWAATADPSPASSEKRRAVQMTRRKAY